LTVKVIWAIFQASDDCSWLIAAIASKYRSIGGRMAAYRNLTWKLATAAKVRIPPKVT